MKDKELLYTAAYDDAATRQTMRDYVLPKLSMELNELRRCRDECSGSVLDHWIEVGMLDDEIRLAQGIAYAESQIRKTEWDT